MQIAELADVWAFAAAETVYANRNGVWLKSLMDPVGDETAAPERPGIHPGKSLQRQLTVRSAVGNAGDAAADAKVDQRSGQSRVVVAADKAFPGAVAATVHGVVGWWTPHEDQAAQSQQWPHRRESSRRHNRTGGSYGSSR
jgi:hypothetical protein